MKTKEIWKTYKGAFDEFTRRTLFKLQSEGHFDELLGPIKMGKESNVFWASKGDGKVALKIYRLMNCDFNKMYEYIRTDSRYLYLKKNRRKVIFAWVQREYRNLLKARDAGLPVPTPYTFKNNILVEEFIGDEEAAPKLQQHHPSHPQEFYDETLSGMAKLEKAGLVHGDLSAFNILNFHDHPVFIDFSHCLPLTSPNAKEYNERDKKNIQLFFNKLL